MGSSKNSTIDKSLKRLLLLVSDGVMPYAVSERSIPVIAMAVIGSSSDVARKKVRASLLRLRVKIED
jgi:hypothetical protein